MRRRDYLPQRNLQLGDSFAQPGAESHLRLFCAFVAAVFMTLLGSSFEHADARSRLVSDARFLPQRGLDDVLLF
jgi:hypothetical protein